MRRLAVALLAGAWLTAGAARAETRPLAAVLDELYATRLVPDAAGVPVVAVGLMDGRDEVRLRAADAGALVMTGYGADGTSFVHAFEAGRTVVIRRTAGSPAGLRYHTVVEAVPHDDRSTLAARIRAWKARGVAVAPLRLGTVQGLGRRVVSTKRYLLSAGVFADEGAAKARAAELAAAFDIEPDVHEELMVRPTAALTAAPDDATAAARSSVGYAAFAAVGGGPVVVENVKWDDGFWRGPAETRAYRGEIYITADRAGRLLAGNRVSIEDLVRGTVPAETILSAAPPAAVRAQAVAARNEVLSNLGTHHTADAYALCSTQRCQVYAGTKLEDPRADAAVAATRGEFLFVGDDLVPARYSAHAGGFTENNDNVWNTAAEPALRGRFDGPDNPFGEALDEAELAAFLDDGPPLWADRVEVNKKRRRWRVTYTADEVSAFVAARKNVGRVLALTVNERGVSGRVVRMTVRGEAGSFTVLRELPVRRLFGNLGSALFAVETAGPAERPDTFTFRGAGWGHGVGMCQTGAMGMAAAGRSHGEILAWYYRGARVERVYD